MIAKFDIEKAYDTINRKVILATLASQDEFSYFVDILDSILYLYSSCSFLINGHPSKFLKISMCMRQGDPLSSYLFILVSQNFTVLLNYALNMALFLVLILPFLIISTT